MSLPWRAVADGIELHVRVTPRAGANRLEGVELRDNGAAVLRLRVAAPPDKGKANAAVVALVAAALGVPKSAVSVVAGETARTKTLRILGNSEALAAVLAARIG